MRAAIQLEVDFDVLTCAACGMAFAVSSDYIRHRRRDHEDFYCPAGHANHFPQESDTEKLQRRLAFEKQRRAEAEREAEQERRSAIAQKAAKTRIKNRVTKGICPCCNRSFTNPDGTQPEEVKP